MSALTFPLLTPRLRVREFAAASHPRLFAADIAALEALYADPRVTARLPFWPRGHTATANHVRRVVAAQQARSRRVYELLVEVRRTGAFAGVCGLVLTTPEAAVKRGHARTAELGYVLARRHWGYGYAQEMVQHLLNAAWAPLGLHSVQAMVAQDHPASVAVLQSAGFVWEAGLPRFTRIRGRWWDCELYSVASAPPAPRSPRGGRLR